MKTRQGFTLIELVMVIVIASILSVFAMAKVGLFSGWQEAGAAQALTSYVFAAQRLAIANKANVYVVATSTLVRACYDAACATPCSNIDGTAMAISAPSGSFVASSSSFYFDSQGRPSFASAYTLTYGSTTVRVEPETGLIS